MLAATHWHEIRICDPSLTLAGDPTPSPVFRTAYEELCIRIWTELELLGLAAERLESRPPRDLVITSAILRLELVVLMDHCRSLRWRHMLAAEQCDTLSAMLTDVLETLHVDSEQLLTAIAIAQDRVFDEIE
jgi:hypothetical protein